MMRPATVLALAAVLGLCACGRKGEPRAPELATPQTIRNLSARADKAGIVLTWSRPTEYVDGRELKDLAAFVIFRKELPPACPDCIAPYRPLTTVFVEDRERFVKQKQYRFIDQEARPGQVYRYRVASQLTDGSLSAPSNEVEIARGP
ncbi:MAG TPA: lipoprotein [candidate division Zixibacteria bacterium]|nr:lipoprotein [candidate division Zixibacteria bacterium]